MTGKAAVGHLTGGDLQRSEQGRGAVADIVVGAALGTARAQRQDRLRAVQRLDLGLQVHAQHDRMLGWMEVQADHVMDPGIEFGIGGELERLDLPGLDAVVARSWRW